VTTYICETCGAQHTPSEAPPEQCAICEDARQWVPEDGQRWTTPDALRDSHRNELRRDSAFEGVGMKPSFAIGQRALLVPWGERTLLWDCVPLLDDEAAAEIDRRGGLGGIAISHPHYYSGMVEWAHRFGCQVHLHADDREWIMRPDPAIELWDGETLDLGRGLTLVRCGGHFAGGTVLHVAGEDALLSGDVVQVIPDRSHVGFMYSYPNLIPLPEATVTAMAAALEPYPFEAIYGAWWNRVIPRDGQAIVLRSAERYARALRGELQ
jgi:hypothetical protein